MKRLGYGIVIIVAILLAGCATTPTAPLTPYLFESFEEAGRIQAVGESWGDGDQSIEVAQTEEWKTEGSSAAVCRFSLSRDTSLGATFKMEGFTKANWKGYTSLQCDFLNQSDSQIQVALALSTGDGWYWQETPIALVEPGLNQNVTFSFTEQNFKSEGSGWNYTGNLEGLKQVMRVAFKFFGPEMEEVTVILDNIQLLP